MDYTYRGRYGEAIYRFKDGMLPSDFFRRNIVLSFQEDAIGIRLPPSKLAVLPSGFRKPSYGTAHAAQIWSLSVQCRATFSIHAPRIAHANQLDG